MQIQKYVIGVDISKSKVDCVVINNHLEVQLEKEVINNDSKLEHFIKAVMRKLKISGEELIICCENTGIYNRPLERVCVEMGIVLWVEHALKIKRASTDMRGKDDRKDASRIAEYCVRYIDRLLPYKEPSEVINKLNVLIKARETLLSQKVAIENQLREAQTHDPFEYKVLRNSYAKTLRSVVKSISDLEAEITILSEQDQAIGENKRLLKTIPGIGEQIAINLIISTDNFTRFASGKHLACYVGVVPFNNQSGTIIKRPRISKMANKNIKRLLHLAAMACIRHCEEFRTYYMRKVAEGKNKMSVLNAIRNKLVQRIMAVIGRQEPYMVKEEFLLKRNNMLAF